MDIPKRPWLARLHWYWILQLSGWSGIFAFMLATYGWALPLKGVLAATVWTAVSGLLLSHAWHKLFTRRGWHAPRLRARMLLIPALACRRCKRSAWLQGSGCCRIRRSTASVSCRWR